jgi:hypothetical protein
MLHQGLTSSHWFSLNIETQMANIGSEIERALKWSEKGNSAYANLANLRALELFDLTLEDSKNKTGLKEITRARELWLDFFLGENQYHQTASLWHKYFHAFTYAAQNK